jgi:hypothetical protein
MHTAIFAIGVHSSLSTVLDQFSTGSFLQQLFSGSCCSLIPSGSREGLRDLSRPVTLLVPLGRAVFGTPFRNALTSDFFS